MDCNKLEFSELKNLTTKEILLLLYERQRVIVNNQTNHLKHHWAITIVCISASAIGLANLCIAMLVLFLSGR